MQAKRNTGIKLAKQVPTVKQLSNNELAKTVGGEGGSRRQGRGGGHR